MGINIFKTQTVENMIENVREEYVDPLIGYVGKRRIDIDSYKTNFDGNARAYLFLCHITFPNNLIQIGSSSSLLSLNNMLKALKSGLSEGLTSSITKGFFESDVETKYYVKSTTLPESTVEETATFFCGNQYKMPSVRRTQDWTVSFYINGDASILKKFIVWNLLLHNPRGGYGKPSDFMSNQTIELLGLDGGVICTYKLFGAWPKTISQVDLDYTNNEMATFDVTFTYQYHMVTDIGGTSYTASNYASGLLGMGINSLVSKLLKR